MKYKGYIVINKDTGSVVGGYPRSGEAHHYTRLGDWTGDTPLDSAVVVWVEGETEE